MAAVAELLVEDHLLRGQNRVVHAPAALVVFDQLPLVGEAVLFLELGQQVAGVVGVESHLLDVPAPGVAGVADRLPQLVIVHRVALGEFDQPHFGPGHVGHAMVAGPADGVLPWAPNEAQQVQRIVFDFPREGKGHGREVGEARQVGPHETLAAAEALDGRRRQAVLVVKLAFRAGLPLAAVVGWQLKRRLSRHSRQTRPGPVFP